MERYALGELGEGERREVERKLRSSELNRRRLEQILADRSELPALPTHARQQPGLRARLARWWIRAGALGVAAATVLLCWPRPRESAGPPGAAQVKGGEVTFELVSEQGARASERFSQGERFKVLLTCPPGFRERLHLLVFQAGRRDEPLASAQFACGNLLPWPGAFALDGEAPVEICVAWGRAVSAAESRQELGGDAVCSVLAPD